MAYKALYRSYRPVNFGEVIGQKHVIQTLKNALKEDKISHAYVFCGLRGIGKTTVARILAKAVNCLDLRNGEPCNECANCKAINENATTDIIELDAASNNGVDEIRNILDKVNFLPSVLKKKVYIIDEVHMLSTAAFNALLKTLEEPPAYVMFILATTEPHKIPMTILSRCQRFDFKQLTLEELTVELELICEKENIRINDEALSGIAEAAEGGMRDALSILDQASVYAEDEVTADDVNAVTGNISNEKLIELIKAFNADDATLSINIVNELLNMGKEVSRLITCVVQFARDLLLYKSVDPTEFNKAIYKKQEFIDLAENTDAKRLFYYIDVLVDVQNKIRFTNSQKIYLEVGIMKIVNSAKEDIDILGRIAALEERINQGGDFSGSSVAPNMNYEQKLLVVENKLKKISNDIEKADLNNFRDTILSKIGMLEDETSKVSALPESIDERVSILENKFLNMEEEIKDVSHDSSSTVVADNSKLSELEQQLASKYQEVNNKVDELNQKVANLSSTDINTVESSVQDTNVSELAQTISDLSEKVDYLELLLEEKGVDLDKDQPNIMDEVAALKAEIAALKDNKYSADNEENNLPSKRNNPYEFKPIDEDIFSVYNKDGESDKSLDDIYKKYDSIRSELDNLKMHGAQNVDLSGIDEKIQKINDMLDQAPDEGLKQTIAELKTNYFLLSQTVAYMGQNNKGVSQPMDNSKLLEIENRLSGLTNEVNSIKLNYLKDGALIPLTEKINELGKEIEDLKLNKPVESKQEEVTKVKNEEPVVAEPKEEVSNEQMQPVVEEKKTLPEEPQTPTVVETVDEETDLTAQIYDEKILLKLLNDAFSREAIAEKEKLVNEWNKLDGAVGGLLASIARMLVNGSLKACGGERLLIVYPNAQMCNDLMEPEKHVKAKEVLKIVFNKDYDFMALPIDVWTEKRAEYREQYRANPESIRLTPFNNPQLKIVSVNKKAIMSDHEKLVNTADEFFNDK